MDASVIDAFEFCQLNGRLEGETSVADLSRLVEDCADSSGVLRWTLVGGTTRLGHAQMTLTVDATVRLMCQRCLTPFDFAIAAKSTLILAGSDERADEIEELLDDESLDVIVGSKAFDVIELVEDEAMLALPLSPRHEVCPDRAAGSTSDDEGGDGAGVGDTKQPFAGLQGLFSKRLQ